MSTETFNITGKVCGKEVNHTNLSKADARQLRDKLFNDNKDGLGRDDYIAVANNGTGSKGYFKPAPNGWLICATYAWAITKDHMPQDDAKEGTNGNAKGIIGPRYGLPLSFDEIVAHPKGQKFRMLNDDGELCYSGVFVDENGRYDGFQPKDDYGEGNAGCTEIQYLEQGVWKTL